MQMRGLYLEWNLPCLALCSWRIRVFSSFTGLGMKPISQPSFTRRPIHQSLLNFYTEQVKTVISSILLTPVSIAVLNAISDWKVHLFDMEEVFRLKGHGQARHGDIVIVTRTVVDICANSKCNWFGLPGGKKKGAR